MAQTFSCILPKRSRNLHHTKAVHERFQKLWLWQPRTTRTPCPPGWTDKPRAGCLGDTQWVQAPKRMQSTDNSEQSSPVEEARWERMYSAQFRWQNVYLLPAHPQGIKEETKWTGSYYVVKAGLKLMILSQPHKYWDLGHVSPHPAECPLSYMTIWYGHTSKPTKPHTCNNVRLYNTLMTYFQKHT